MDSVWRVREKTRQRSLPKSWVHEGAFLERGDQAWQEKDQGFSVRHLFF